MRMHSDRLVSSYCNGEEDTHVDDDVEMGPHLVRLGPVTCLAMLPFLGFIDGVLEGAKHQTSVLVEQWHDVYCSDKSCSRLGLRSRKPESSSGMLQQHNAQCSLYIVRR